MTTAAPAPDRREPLALLAVAVAAVAISAIAPKDRLTWFMEAAPVIAGAPILIATWARFPMTSLVYQLLLIHALILLLGAHYTYAEVPPGFWVRDWLGLERNHYDRLGHLAQGFVPAILAREILLRTSPLRRGKWLFALATCVCLAFSAFYEMIEWWSALAGGGKSEAFLGTQGDPWDTQWDMFLALIGAMTAQLCLARSHDRALARLGVAAR